MTATSFPSLIALAGPNGAGKSTAGPSLLKDTLGVTEFVNAEPRLIASGRTGGVETVADRAAWSMITREYADAD